MFKFSVLISVYIKDNPEFLQEALDSISSQTLLPDEIVIVEDGPITDRVRMILDAFCSKHANKCKRVVLEENVGLGVALNEGLKFCSFNYVARMDTDDICIKDRFYKQMTYLQDHDDVSAVGGYLSEFNETPGDLNRIKRVPLTPADIHKSIVKRNPMNHPTVMFKRADILACGSYNDVPFFEDYYLWFELNKYGFKMSNIPDVILNFRIGNDMIGRRHGWSYMVKEFKFILKLVDNELITKGQAILMAVLRLPIRIMPKMIISGVYKLLLR